MSEKKDAVRDPYSKRKMRTYFQFSMIAFVFVVIAAVVMFLSSSGSDSIDYSKSDFVQLKEPADNAPVVVFETTEGEFRAVLYEDEAPEYCEFFEKLVNDGYFDDTYVCTILRSKGGETGGFIGGSKTVDGAASNETDMTMKKVEISQNMLPVKGSLGSLVKQGGKFTSAKAGSVFTVLYDVVDVDELRDNEAKDVNGYKRVSSVFEQYGGVPNYLQMYTLFGQVYDGWDVIDKINSYSIVGEDTDDDDANKNYQPEKEIKFTKVYMSTYGEKKENGFVIPEKQAASADSKSESSAESKE